MICPTCRQPYGRAYPELGVSGLGQPSANGVPAVAGGLSFWQVAALLLLAWFLWSQTGGGPPTQFGGGDDD